MKNVVPFPRRAVPARPVPTRPAPRPGLVPDRSPVSLEWDQGRAVHVAVCERCTETLTSERLDQAHTWAEEHHCDPELAALLDQITRRTA